MAKTIPVIDMWSPIVPSHEIMEHVAHHFPELQLSYLSIFQKRDVSLAEYREVALAMAMDDDALLALYALRLPNMLKSNNSF